MPMTDEQYERIAGWLDGRDVALSEAERAVADEIRRDERMLASAGGGDWPRKALVRASRRMTAELARPSRRLWVSRLAAAGAVAAAIIVAAALLPTGPVGTKRPVIETLGTVIAGPDLKELKILIEKAEESIGEMEESIRPGVVVELLAGELESIEAEMLVTAEVGGTDLEINAMEDELDSILLDPAEPWSFNNGV